MQRQLSSQAEESTQQRVSLSEMGGEEWPSGENTITSVCAAAGTGFDQQNGISDG